MVSELNVMRRKLNAMGTQWRIEFDNSMIRKILLIQKSRPIGLIVGINNVVVYDRVTTVLRQIPIQILSLHFLLGKATNQREG
jgi:hypothetical protein